MSISFRAPDRGDPERYLARTIEKFGDVNPDVLQQIGQTFVEAILTRTADGESYKGFNFHPYSESYRVLKIKRGGDSSVVDLFLSGGMLGALTARVRGGKISIGIFDNAEEATKAKVHNEGSHIVVRLSPTKSYSRRRPVRRSVGQKRKPIGIVPARPFLGITQADILEAQKVIAASIIAEAKENI